jgi:hypothetical protein
MARRTGTDGFDFDINVDGEQARAEMSAFQQSLKKTREPIESLRSAFATLGVASNSALGNIVGAGAGLAGAGGKAGILIAGVVGVTAGVAKMVEALDAIERSSRQFDAMSEKLSVTQRDVDSVTAAFRLLTDDLDRGAIQKLIITGREAGLSVAEIQGLGTAAKQAADLAGTSFEEGFAKALDTVAKKAHEARDALQKYLQAKHDEAEIEKKGQLRVGTEAALDEVNAEIKAKTAEREDVLRRLDQAKRGAGSQGGFGLGAVKDILGLRAQEERLQDELDQLVRSRTAVRGEARKAQTLDIDKGISEARLQKAQEDADRGKAMAAAELEARRGAQEAAWKHLELLGRDFEAARLRAHADYAAKIKKIDLDAAGDPKAKAYAYRQLQQDLENVDTQEQQRRVEKWKQEASDENAAMQPFFDFLKLNQVRATYVVDEESGKRIVSIKKEYDEIEAAADAALTLGKLTPEEYAAKIASLEKAKADAIAEETRGFAKRVGDADEAQRKQANATKAGELGSSPADAILQDILRTQDAVNEFKASLADMGNAGAAAWGAIGAASQLGSQLVQAAANAVKQTIVDLLTDTGTASEIQVQQIENRVLARDQEVSSIEKTLQTTKDASERERALARLDTKETQARTQAEGIFAKTSKAASAERTAAVLANIASEAAVRTVFEGAEALASLAVGDARGAALHGAAAAAYATIGGITAAAAASVAANRDQTLSEQQQLEDLKAERDKRRARADTDANARRADASSRLAEDGPGTVVHINFFGRPLVSEAEVGAAIEQALDKWKGHK